MEFKYRLRDLRREKNLTGAELGKILNLKKTTISSWENGKSYPEVETLLKLAKYFDVSLDYLMGLNNATPEDKSILDNLTSEELFAVKSYIDFLKEKKEK